MNALGDAYTSPLMCEALNRHRGACLQPSDDIAWTPPARDDPRDHSHVKRWEPWVRSYLCAQALISQLDFHVYGATDTKGHRGDPASTLPAYQQGEFSVTMTTYLRGKAGQGRRIRLATLVRPPDDVFEQQLDLVMAWADLREERTPEILAQMSNTLAFWGTMIPVHTDRLRSTREILEAAVQFAMFVEMRFKHELACWRPNDRFAQIQPMIATPGHGSLPSGHCTEAYVIMEVLQALLGMSVTKSSHQNLRQQFARTAARIATNRVVAGVHFPIDSIAGRLLGTVLGRFFVYCCTAHLPPRGVPAFHEGAFIGPLVPGDQEFDPERQPILGARPAGTPVPPRAPFYEYDPVAGLASLEPPDTVLKPLWEAARRELTALGWPYS